MPVARSTRELENMLHHELRKAMKVTQEKSEADMHEEVGLFYTWGEPTIYQRTGGLGSSPRTTALNDNGNSMGFDAYLSQDQGWYGRGNPNPAFTSRGYKSYFSPLQILNAAEYHLAHVKGRPQFWHRATIKMERDYQNTLEKFGFIKG